MGGWGRWVNRTVGVDVIHISGLETSHGQSHVHRVGQAFSFRVGGGDVVGVAGGAIAVVKEGRWVGGWVGG